MRLHLLPPGIQDSKYSQLEAARAQLLLNAKGTMHFNITGKTSVFPMAFPDQGIPIVGGASSVSKSSLVRKRVPVFYPNQLLALFIDYGDRPHPISVAK